VELRRTQHVIHSLTLVATLALKSVF